ncbi:hypothetical protein RW1_095_03500 [Rhodococcus wratislaviensis NBRC 100605]|uniref:Glycosyl hydrolase-like family 15 (GHL15) protein n=1 Tax=Rhodococcus wratislaviensis NBRC 100605 TaxID=1219028 RepID=X0RI09_RHOWR|nr:hypothetical protein RW1_095_03500 [Rhodococcus wratislaviensis NBRC 100605]
MRTARGPRCFRWPKRLHLALAALVTASVLSVSCDAPLPEAVHCPTAEPQSLTFPRTATYYLDQHVLPPVEELARYDVVIIDHEWAHRISTTFFDQLRKLNQRLRLLAYVNMVDHPDQLGTYDYWAQRYRLWQFQSSTESTFPEQWLAGTSTGLRVSQWPNTLMANLTDTAPRINGRTYAEYAAEWVVDQVWSTGVWDGIFLDVWGDRIFGADHDRWDVDVDGIDEPDEEIYGFGNPWERGVNLAEQLMRARMPGAILVANGDRTLRDEQLNGRVWESFADPDARTEPLADLDRYVALSAGPDHRPPGVSITIDRRRAAPASPREFQRARYFLAATLMQNGYWAPMGADYSETVYYDEMDGGGLGRGYLGQPVMANPCPAALEGSYADGFGSLGDGVFRRDFEHGTVLLNTSGTARDVSLDLPLRRLRGTQDPVTNNGETVESVTLPPHDGLFLVNP